MPTLQTESPGTVALRVDNSIFGGKRLEYAFLWLIRVNRQSSTLNDVLGSREFGISPQLLPRPLPSIDLETRNFKPS